MEIQYIKEFLVLGEICNYGRAADALFISQSSLFNHVKALETELGVALFDRAGKKIVLSDYGRIFLPYAKTIIDASDQYVTAIHDNKHEELKTIRVGTQYRITDLVKSFRSQHKEYVLHVLDSFNSMDVLNNGDCELAFIRNVPPDDERYHTLPYFTDSIVAALYSSHPMAHRKSISLTELKKENFIMISQYQEKECHGISICKSAGFIPKVVMMAVNGNEAAKLVNDGTGISLFLKETIVSEKFDNLALIDLEPPIICDISLCWRKDTELSQGAEAFVQYARNYHGVHS